MSECKICRGQGSFQCSYCKAYFCNEHLPPHKHYCTHISQEDIISEIVDKATLSDVSAYIARIAIYTSIMIGAVVAVDVVILLLLTLLTDVDMWLPWLTLLFIESFFMMFFGWAEYASGAANVTWDDSSVVIWIPPKYRVRYRYSWLWFSLGLAGLALVVLATYLFLHVKA